jgi:hypothetical protein
MPKPRIRMLVPLWGSAYFTRWFGLPAASLLSEGNIPYLKEYSDFELVFLTKRDDMSFLQGHSIFRRLQEQVDMSIITIDEFFPTKASVTYGVPLTLAYGKGVQDLGEAGIGAFVILMNADFVLSEGSLRMLLDRIQQGFHIVTAPSIRVVDHLARPKLQSLISKRSLHKGISAREMMTIANQNLHQTVLARVLNRPELIEAWYYHLIYWRINPTCLAARYFLLMPLCFQFRRQFQAITSPIDYGFLQQVCPGGNYCVLRDSDDFLMVELQEQDSEASLLRVAPKFASTEEAIESKKSDVIANAGVWATVEHRRAVEHTLLFHSEDLPATIDEQVSEFDQHMARMLNEMPPPVPTSRHFHWLAALRDYRSRMSVDRTPYPDLLLHDLNRAYVPILDQPVAEQDLPKEGPSFPGEQNDVAVECLREAVVILTIDCLMPEIAILAQSIHTLAIPLDEIHSTDMEMQFVLPTLNTLSAGIKLGMYITFGTIAHLSKLSSVISNIIGFGGEVLIFVRGKEKYFSLARLEYSWILSRLQYSFPSGLYRAQIELFRAATRNSSKSFEFPLFTDLTDFGHAPRDDLLIGFSIRLSAPE